MDDSNFTAGVGPHEGVEYRLTDDLTIQPGTECDRVWLSFGGDPALKDACATRLKEVADADLLHASYPSCWLVGAPNRFEIVVGAPAALGDLLDAVHTLLRFGFDESSDAVARTTARARLLEIVEAMPVGADLRRIVPDVLHEFVYSSKWAITPHFTGPAAELVAKLKGLHELERRGANIPEIRWHFLRQDAVRLKKADTRSVLTAELEALAYTLAYPQTYWLVGDVIHALLMMKSQRAERLFLELCPAKRDDLMQFVSEGRARFGSEVACSLLQKLRAML